MRDSSANLVVFLTLGRAVEATRTQIALRISRPNEVDPPFCSEFLVSEAPIRKSNLWQQRVGALGPTWSLIA
jgi:hypothetical protein